jgi:predicted transcriptional regulator of viral defense system
MKTQEFLNLLKKLRKPVYTINEIFKILKKDENYTRVFLSRLEKKSLIKRIEKGKYFFKDENPFAIASNLVFPSYISFISALSYYGLTTQIPRTIFVVSLKQKKKLEFNGYEIQFVKFNKKRFFGYKREKTNRKFLFVGEIEKVIADSLFLPKYCPLSEILFALKNARVSIDKLILYSSKMGSKVVLKRLGYLMELASKDLYEKLKAHIDSKYDLLNPSLKPRGKVNKKWKLVINEVL